MRKLTLRRETVRTLMEDDLEGVAGGTVTGTYPETCCPNDTYSQGCYTYAGCTTLGSTCPKRRILE